MKIVTIRVSLNNIKFIIYWLKVIKLNKKEKNNIKNKIMYFI